MVVGVNLVIMHVCRDECPVGLATDLRQYFPFVPKVCLVDGSCGDGWAEVCDRYSIRLIHGERLKPLENGAAWLKRWFNTALEHCEDGLILKIDSDCRIRRQPSQPPDCDAAGHLACHLLNHQLYLRGGAIVYQRSAIAAMVDSGILDRPHILNRNNFAYYNQGDLCHSEDQTIGLMFQLLKLQYGQWDDVYNAWREDLPEVDAAIVGFR